ncbi:hypothetical protein [Absidia glauca]|uniref:Uncharacterized protein n=1 Tax=Absidia glauca TaxID=4829 RepID=A0A168SLC9_ABSGL|nr:hypothetical protein [Absidia glauca]
MNRLLLIYSICLLYVYSSFVHGYDLTLDGLQTTIQELSFKEYIHTAYDSALLYRDYLRNKVEEVTINELEKTNGSRLPILCSTDDYFYYLVRYLPSPMKTYVLDRYDERYPSQHRYSTSEERNEQFYLTIKGLPPTIKDKAVVAKDELQSYLSAAPDTGLYDMIDEYSFKWDHYIDSDIKTHLTATRKDLVDKLTTHRKMLQEYIDQGNVVVELFGNPEPVDQDKHQHHPYETTHHLWMGESERLSLLMNDQQKAYKQWHQTVELGFLDAVTTLGPLRRLAEEMFDDAMNKTLEALTTLQTTQVEGLAGWINLSMDSVDKLDRHLASLPLTTTPAAVDQMKREIDNVFARCTQFLDQIKVAADSQKTISSIGKIWSNARKELTYSRWQWKYWVNLWNEEGLNVILRLFSPTNQ